jgi:predicted ATP-dependent endonuclease of OLD family
MYIKRIKIENIRSVKELEWSLPESKPAAGWHVIVGDNGSGKTSFLRSIALAMVGPKHAAGLRLSWDDWLRKGETHARINLTITRNHEIDKLSKGSTLRARQFSFGVVLGVSNKIYDRIIIDGYGSSVRPDHHVWSGEKGWFCAAYGPFRRLTGGDVEFEFLSMTLPKLARFLSIFDERVALTDCLDWLQTLRFQQLEMRQKAKSSAGVEFLDKLIHFVNQPDFLPFQARLKEITSQQVVFLDGNHKTIGIEQLSDGYRSILSMTFDLIRQLSIVYGPDSVFDEDDPGKVGCEGVVLIDEVDAHLHPTWQRRIGLWFRKHFPNIQFLVSSHSPIICQAADVGTVFRLPRPGVDESGAMVEGTQLQRLLYGNVLDAYGTEAFGLGVTRSDASKAMSKRLAELNVKDVQVGLTAEEKKERDKLRAAMPTEAASVG